MPTPILRGRWARFLTAVTIVAGLGALAVVPAGGVPPREGGVRVFAQQARATFQAGDGCTLYVELTEAIYQELGPGTPPSDPYPYAYVEQRCPGGWVLTGLTELGSVEYGFVHRGGAWLEDVTVQVSSGGYVQEWTFTLTWDLAGDLAPRVTGDGELVPVARPDEHQIDLVAPATTPSAAIHDYSQLQQLGPTDLLSAEVVQALHRSTPPSP